MLAVEVHNSDLGRSDLSFLPTLWGYDEPPPDAVLTVGPYLQLLGRREVTVCWETDLPVAGRVAWGPAGGPLDRLADDPVVDVRHELRLAGLEPGGAYEFRVESVRRPSATARFRTAGDAAEPFRFVALGDTRSSHADHAAVIAGIAAESPDFLLHVGDLVASGAVESNWTTFFSIERDVVARAPLYPTLGNHEGAGTRYLELFVLPDGMSGTERYYAFVHASAAVVVLDEYGSTFGAGSAQLAWAEGIFRLFAEDPAIRRRFVLLHHGPYDSGPHGSQTTIRDAWVPLFEEYGVDVVFAGHDHDYERGTVSGIHYVVTGAGGAPLYRPTGDWWTVVAESVLSWVTVDVEGPLAEVAAWRVDGTRLDHFVLGDGLTECAEESDCAGRTTGACGPGDEGAWACVHGGCVWNCTAPGADADADADVGSEGGVDADADAGSDAGFEVAADAAVSTGGKDGCGCRATGGGATPAALLLLLPAALVGPPRQRRAEQLVGLGVVLMVARQYAQQVISLGIRRIILEHRQAKAVYGLVRLARQQLRRLEQTGVVYA